ncbi:MAG: L,D-transpeptidase family protein [Sediminibacterium sp.]|nr:L,D-transpeptidase family protein [Hydrotalea sp.]MCU0336702.1 L,D-transpeptidase family protein [Sediminibacterium sp.]
MRWISLMLGLAFSQIGFSQGSFLESQRTFPRVAQAMRAKEDTIRKQFERQNLQWPIKDMYIRSFKYDSQLEVWVRSSKNEPYQLFKQYKVCAMSGSLGPKRIEGDYQVPEGFYYVNEFNPRSQYHLALGLNYPNLSDRVLSDTFRPGGEIYIHGACITVGCIPIQNHQIEELYILASYAKHAGQDFIPVHVFPIHFQQEKSQIALQRAVDSDPSYARFVDQIKNVYDHFEKNKTLPIISVNKKGEYIIL